MGVVLEINDPSFLAMYWVVVFCHHALSDGPLLCCQLGHEGLEKSAIVRLQGFDICYAIANFGVYIGIKRWGLS